MHLKKVGHNYTVLILLDLLGQSEVFTHVSNNSTNPSGQKHPGEHNSVGGVGRS